MPTFSLVSETHSSEMSPTTYQSTLVSVPNLILAVGSCQWPNPPAGPSSPAAAAPTVGAERIQGRSAAIDRYGSSEYESLLGRGRGRPSIRLRCERNRHRSFGNLRPRGRAPSETPHRATGPIHFFAPDFAAAAARGLVVEEFVDTGVSGAKSSRPARNRLQAPDRSGARPAGWTAGDRLRGYFAPVDQLRSGVAGDLPKAQRGGKLTDRPVHDFGNVGLQRAGAGNDRTEGGGGCEEGTGYP